VLTFHHKRHVENLDPSYPSAEWVIRDIKKYTYYKVILDNKIIGGLYLVDKNDSTAVIEDFCIEPIHQGQGYGYKVMMLIEKMKPQYKVWKLVTPIYSVGNQALYEKLGYVKVGSSKEDCLDVFEYQKHICVIDEDINLEYARIHEKKLVYEMLVSPEVYDYMFDHIHPAPTLEDFCEEPDDLYGGKPNEEGNYLIIKYQGHVIGSISYALNEGSVRCYELDIWISKKEYLGKGIGTKSIQLLIDYLVNTYGIKTYLIRPWAKNENAIKAYKKCGFAQIEKEELQNYYSEEDYISYGDGDYGDNTVNLVLK